MTSWVFDCGNIQIVKLPTQQPCLHSNCHECNVLNCCSAVRVVTSRLKLTGRPFTFTLFCDSGDHRGAGACPGTEGWGSTALSTRGVCWGPWEPEKPPWRQVQSHLGLRACFLWTHLDLFSFLKTSPLACLCEPWNFVHCFEFPSPPHTPWQKHFMYLLHFSPL